MINMKKMAIKEINILAEALYEKEVPLKLGKDILKLAKDFTYTNDTRGKRLNEYRGLIKYHTRENG